MASDSQSTALFPLYALIYGDVKYWVERVHRSAALLNKGGNIEYCLSSITGLLWRPSLVCWASDLDGGQTCRGGQQKKKGTGVSLHSSFRVTERGGYESKSNCTPISASKYGVSVHLLKANCKMVVWFYGVCVCELGHYIVMPCDKL